MTFRHWFLYTHFYLLFFIVFDVCCNLSCSLSIALSLKRFSTVSMILKTYRVFFFQIWYTAFNTTPIRFLKKIWSHSVGFYTGADHSYLDFMGIFLAIFSRFLLVWRQWKRKRESSQTSRQALLIHKKLFLMIRREDFVFALFTVSQLRQAIPYMVTWSTMTISQLVWSWCTYAISV